MNTAKAEQGVMAVTDMAKIEQVLMAGDLSQLKPEERVSYYRMVCESVGLNPLTKPFEYITLNGRLTLYARKDCTDQLRQARNVSIMIVAREFTEGCYVVTARAILPSGRTDESIGAVPVETLKGEARANALMKCETKAKRRVTLSVCGLGMLDETEVDSIPSAKPVAIAESITLVPKQPPVEVPEAPVEAVPVEEESPYINQHQRSSISRRFRESIKPLLEPDANLYRHAALTALHQAGKFKSKLVDDQGNPTQDYILKSEYAQIGAELVKAAKAL